MLMRRLADASLAVVLVLAFLAGMGSPRPLRAHDARSRHPHSVLAPRHGHAPRPGIKTAGRDDEVLMPGDAGTPPATAALIAAVVAPMPETRSGAGAHVRGPPSRAPVPFRDNLSRRSEYRSGPAHPFPASTTTRLPRRERADRVEGAPARGNPSLAGGDS